MKTIRYYDRVGVLHPEERNESGYRLYGEDALDRYRFVRAAQAIGLRLGEIREIIALRDQGETRCGFVVELIGRRTAELDARIAELESLRDELRRIDRRARRLDPLQCHPPARLPCHRPRCLNAWSSGGHDRRSGSMSGQRRDTARGVDAWGHDAPQPEALPVTACGGARAAA